MNKINLDSTYIEVKHHLDQHSYQRKCCEHYCTSKQTNIKMSSSTYACEICSKLRKICPYFVGQSSKRHSSLNSSFNINKKNEEKVRFHSKTQKPKVRFEYHSNSQPFHVNPPREKLIIRERILQIPRIQPSIEEIIFYPVFHNRFVFVKNNQVNPEHQGKHKENPRKSCIRKNKKLTINQFIGSTLPNEPLTPQQFRKMADSFVQQK